MKDIVSLGLLAVGGYLLYSYFYGGSMQTVLTRGSLPHDSNAPSRPASSVVGTTSSGASVIGTTNNGMIRQTAPITNYATELANRTARKTGHTLAGLGVISRGDVMYTRNPTSRDNLNGGSRSISATMNLGETLMSGRKGIT